MNRKLTRPSSIFLLIIFLFETIAPSVTWALTGGPSQPEVQSFEPVGTTQMVDLFSGDFNYNIPIMDIDGYPINLAYHSGITMDQEASWVGLGWNLNPGVINRNMRGLPDDFNGDEIKKELRHNNDNTVGVNAGVDFEIFGFPKSKVAKSLRLGFNMGINYNNFKGVGFDFGIVPSYNCGDKIKSKYSLGLNYSSRDGASLQPHVSFTKSYNGGLNSAKIGGGFNLNSRHGLKSVNLKFSLQENEYNKKMNNGEGGYENKRDQEIGGVSYNSFSSTTYTPSITMPMGNSNASLSFKTGPDAFGFDAAFSISGYYSEQYIIGESVTRKAFGLQYLQNSDNDQNMLDFNREKDGSYSVENPTIGIPQLTQDLFSYSGQGIGGMFKSYRNDIPVVSDPSSSNKPSFGGGVGGEVGGGNLIKIGTDFSMNYSSSTSNRWKEFNSDIFQDLKSYDHINNPLFEYSYFKNIGEKTIIDNSFNPYSNLNKDFELGLLSIYLPVSNLKYKYGVGIDKEGEYQRENRDKRNVHIKALTNDEKNFCLNKDVHQSIGKGVGSYVNAFDRKNSNRKGWHNSEFSVVKADGTKYIYGIAAYNNLQKEYSFTNAKDIKTKKSPAIDCATGEVNYNTEFEDYRGIDSHKEIVTTPAYAHSYLLTDILSADYQDVDNNGTSVNDLGTYTKINYSLANSSYRWRVPYNKDRANYNRGLRSDVYDDNANFIYGEKEIWHVHSIEGKNHIAYFYTSERDDAYGVITEKGGIGNAAIANSGIITVSNSSKSYKLDSVVLYSKYDLSKPIKTAVFEYNYYLCPKVPNNKYTLTEEDLKKTGKLTLKKVYFKYGTSNKGKYNSYKFEYNDDNTAYNNPYHLKGYDSWGNYKPAEMNISNTDGTINPCGNGTLLSSEFPYVEQYKPNADIYVAQWTLSKILLPSGGAIEIEYESDDYAYVQDKQAMQMYRLLGFGNKKDGNYYNNLYTEEANKNNNILYFEVPQEAQLADLKKGIDQMYFNVLVDINNKNNFEYIRGYTKLSNNSNNIGFSSASAPTANKKIAWVEIETVNIKKNKPDQVNPISAAGFNFARLNLPQLINPDANSIKGGMGGTESFARSLYGFWPEMYNLFNGHNFKLISDGFCSKAIPAKSWIRLNNTNGYKLGGGSRVKKLKSIDNWAIMEGLTNAPNNKTNIFTQNFEYKTENGKDASGKPILISSGVASYEPQAGGDENPFRELANPYSRENTFVPDEEYFTEKPYGESYFPSAGVGYSKVTVKSGNDAYINDPVTRTGTGKVVNEFYTAKDFPTIVSDNKANVLETGTGLIWALLFVSSDKGLKMTQNQRIELNDMHGKPKAVWNYKHNNINSSKTEDAYSGIVYEYFETIENGKRQLSNEVTVVGRDGKIDKAIVGVDAEVVIDSREFNSFSFSGGIDFNLNVAMASILPLVTLTAFPSVNIEKTQFKSACSMKMVNKYGILKRTIAYEEGASLTTENTVFDKETGEVLVTKTQNEFDDFIYNTTYPAHWVYEGMGQASINQGAVLTIVPNGTNNSNFKVSYKGNTLNPDLFFYHGDLIMIAGSPNKYWVYKDENGLWRIMNEAGLFQTISPANIKIIESGRKNMQTMPIASYTQLRDPAKETDLDNNVTILNASVTEYDSLGKINNCFNKKLPSPECLTDLAESISQWFIDRGEFTIANLKSTTYFPNGVREITIDPFTTDYSFIAPSKKYGTGTLVNKYLELHKKLFPNKEIKVKLFGKKISPDGTPEDMVQYEIGYEFEPIDYTLDCTNYKVNLEFRGHTYDMSSNMTTNSVGDFPPDRNNQLLYNCSLTTTSNTTTPECILPVNRTLSNNTEILDFFIGPNTNNNPNCECTPTSMNDGTQLDALADGSCFNGDLGFMFELKASISEKQQSPLPFKYLTGYSTADVIAYANIKKTRPYPYNTFFTAGSPQARSIIKVKNGSIESYARNFRHYVYSKYLETPVCNLTPVTEVVNPFKKGLQNNWKSKRSWVYVNKRLPENGVSNIRKDGTYKEFNNFWKQDAVIKRPIKNSSKWQFTNETTKHNINGAVLESKNALGIYNASLYGFNNTIPIAVANNAKYNQILSYNYEQDGSINDTLPMNVSCPAQHGMFDLQKQFIDTEYFHTGNSSYKVEGSIVFSSVSCNNKMSSLYPAAQTTTASGGYKTSEADYLGVFVPSEGKYVLSTWIKVGKDATMLNYNNAGVQIILSNGTISNTYTFKPNGAIIDGWQKVDGTFSVSVSHNYMTIKLFSDDGKTSYFDDFRIQPFNAAMNTYVYDNRSLKIMAELDDNNYATFYEYDNEGNLVRIKKETEKGIVTIKEARNSFKKNR